MMTLKLAFSIWLVVVLIVAAMATIPVGTDNGPYWKCFVFGLTIVHSVAAFVALCVVIIAWGTGII